MLFDWTLCLILFNFYMGQLDCFWYHFFRSRTVSIKMRITSSVVFTLPKKKKRTEFYRCSTQLFEIPNLLLLKFLCFRFLSIHSSVSYICTSSRIDNYELLLKQFHLNILAMTFNFR
jgi:hypothetical protein